VRDTVFLGRIELGQRCGISRAKLSDVTVGDNTIISDVHGWISNVVIESGVLIENIGSLSCIGKTSFGNGHVIPVMVEAGGRELAITHDTSAQIGYMTVAWRGRTKLMRRLSAMAEKSARTIAARRMTIGAGARIVNCGEIVNVQIGAHAQINGALRLCEGTIVSSVKAPVVVSAGVIADNFIFQQGSSVTDGSLVSATLVGEATSIGKQFSSEKSVFFSNSECFHSEACSIFAGPHTATHHRSTLLIAGMFSFYNAGSGTNQSNHLYRLGPVHQGVLERGCKTGSSAYLIWPTHVGAFSTVVKQHFANFDTSEFPFSLITSENGVSMIVPGKTFFTAGLLRDEEKWPARDRRTSDPLDCISHSVLSPYTCRRMIDGRVWLQTLDKKPGTEQIVMLDNISIRRTQLAVSADWYQKAIEIYFGTIVIARLGQKKAPSLSAFLKPDAHGESYGDWVDLGGLLCPKSRVDKLCEGIESGEISAHGQITAACKDMHARYLADEWNWFLREYEEFYGRTITDNPKKNLSELLERWRTASITRYAMILENCEKEFGDEAMVGFGLDDDEPHRDFAAVRGDKSSNAFVKRVTGASKAITKTFARAAKVLAAMR
nr:DUF4954 family protein [Chitinispirillaceae bacterium]